MVLAISLGLIFCYRLKKTAAESHRMLVEAYGEHALGKTQCFEWFNKFKSGNFDVRNEDRGKPPKKFEDWDQRGVIYYLLLLFVRKCTRIAG